MKVRQMWLVVVCLTLSVPWARAADIRVKDDLGKQVVLAQTPLRIVSLAPSNTEILFAVGAGDRVVGVTEWCNFPAAAREIQQVAGYSDLNIERITAVGPDLIIAARGNDLDGLRALEQMGVPIFALNVQSLASMVDAIRRIGELTATTAHSDSVAAALEGRLKVIDARVQGLPRPRVLWGYVAEPVYTAGP
ncbi:MAG: ABC transporter substrate-binding protein, partial [Gemmatimonadetes bacterium]|nr:ABC transporter substrate-binding protein [Gemmatimonadota bacterium]